ncbi:MAG: hypothetical protein V2B14_00450 [bacterium]
MSYKKFALNHKNFLIKTTIALAATVSLLNNQPCFSSGVPETVITASDNTSITGSNIKVIQPGSDRISGDGKYAVSSYSQFDLKSGDKAIMVFPTGVQYYINRVNSNPFNIDGEVEGRLGSQTGNIGGHLILASPHGINVGTSGIVSAGHIIMTTAGSIKVRDTGGADFNTDSINPSVNLKDAYDPANVVTYDNIATYSDSKIINNGIIRTLSPQYSSNENSISLIGGAIESNGTIGSNNEYPVTIDSVIYDNKTDNVSLIAADKVEFKHIEGNPGYSLSREVPETGNMGYISLLNYSALEGNDIDVRSFAANPSAMNSSHYPQAGVAVNIEGLVEAKSFSDGAEISNGVVRLISQSTTSAQGYDIRIGGQVTAGTEAISESNGYVNIGGRNVEMSLSPYGRIISRGNIEINASEDFYANDQTYIEARNNIQINADQNFNLINGSIFSGENISINANNILISNDAVSADDSSISSDGNITLEASNNLTLSGFSLLDSLETINLTGNNIEISNNNFNTQLDNYYIQAYPTIKADKSIYIGNTLHPANTVKIFGNILIQSSYITGSEAIEGYDGLGNPIPAQTKIISTSNIDINNIDTESDFYLNRVPGSFDYPIFKAKNIGIYSSSGTVNIFGRTTLTTDLEYLDDLGIYIEAGTGINILKSTMGSYLGAQLIANDKLNLKTSNGQIQLQDSNLQSIGGIYIRAKSASSGSPTGTVLILDGVNIASGSGNIAIIGDKGISITPSSENVQITSDYGNIGLFAKEGNITLNNVDITAGDKFYFYAGAGSFYAGTGTNISATHEIYSAFEDLSLNGSGTILQTTGSTDNNLYLGYIPYSGDNSIQNAFDFDTADSDISELVLPVDTFLTVTTSSGAEIVSDGYLYVGDETNHSRYIGINLNDGCYSYYHYQIEPEGFPTGFTAANGMVIYLPTYIDSPDSDISLISGDSTDIDFADNHFIITPGNIAGIYALSIYDHFDLTSDESIIMVLPTGVEFYINRINGNPLTINGNIESRLGSSTGDIGGHLIFISPAGITVGSDSTINTGSLLFATSSSTKLYDTNSSSQVDINTLSLGDFSGKNFLDPSDSSNPNNGIVFDNIGSSSIQNCGNITANDTIVNFIGGSITNTGAITASEINLLAAEKIELLPVTQGVDTFMDFVLTEANNGYISLSGTESSLHGDSVNIKILTENTDAISIEGEIHATSKVNIISEETTEGQRKNVNVEGKILVNSGTPGEGRIYIEAGDISVSNDSIGNALISSSGNIYLTASDILFLTGFSLLNSSGNIYLSAADACVHIENNITDTQLDGSTAHPTIFASNNIYISAGDDVDILDNIYILSNTGEINISANNDIYGGTYDDPSGTYNHPSLTAKNIEIHSDSGTIYFTGGIKLRQESGWTTGEPGIYIEAGGGSIEFSSEQTGSVYLAPQLIANNDINLNVDNGSILLQADNNSSLQITSFNGDICIDAASVSSYFGDISIIGGVNIIANGSHIDDLGNIEIVGYNGISISGSTTSTLHPNISSSYSNTGLFSQEGNISIAGNATISAGNNIYSYSHDFLASEGSSINADNRIYMVFENLNLSGSNTILEASNENIYLGYISTLTSDPNAIQNQFISNPEEDRFSIISPFGEVLDITLSSGSQISTGGNLHVGDLESTTTYDSIEFHDDSNDYIYTDNEISDLPAGISAEGVILHLPEPEETPGGGEEDPPAGEIYDNTPDSSISVISGDSTNIDFSDNHFIITPGNTAGLYALSIYDHFSLTSDESITMVFPTGIEYYINRMDGNNQRFNIYGNIESRLGSSTGNIGGHLIFIGPNGINIGPNATINAGSILMSTSGSTWLYDTNLNIRRNINNISHTGFSISNFLDPNAASNINNSNNVVIFTNIGTNSIINQGNIFTGSDGNISLIGGAIVNKGSIGCDNTRNINLISAGEVRFEKITDSNNNAVMDYTMYTPVVNNNKGYISLNDGIIKGNNINLRSFATNPEALNSDEIAQPGVAINIEGEIQALTGSDGRAGRVYLLSKAYNSTLDHNIVVKDKISADSSNALVYVKANNIDIFNNLPMYDDALISSDGSITLDASNDINLSGFSLLEANNNICLLADNDINIYNNNFNHNLENYPTLKTNNISGNIYINSGNDINISGNVYIKSKAQTQISSQRDININYNTTTAAGTYDYPVFYADNDIDIEASGALNIYDGTKISSRGEIDLDTENGPIYLQGSYNDSVSLTANNIYMRAKGSIGDNGKISVLGGVNLTANNNIGLVGDNNLLIGSGNIFGELPVNISAGNNIGLASKHGNISINSGNNKYTNITAGNNFYSYSHDFSGNGGSKISAFNRIFMAFKNLNLANNGTVLKTENSDINLGFIPFSGNDSVQNQFNPSEDDLNRLTPFSGNLNITVGPEARIKAGSGTKNLLIGDPQNRSAYSSIVFNGTTYTHAYESTSISPTVEAAKTIIYMPKEENTTVITNHDAVVDTSGNIKSSDGSGSINTGAIVANLITQNQNQNPTQNQNSQNNLSTGSNLTGILNNPGSTPKIQAPQQSALKFDMEFQDNQGTKVASTSGSSGDLPAGNRSSGASNNENSSGMQPTGRTSSNDNTSSGQKSESTSQKSSDNTKSGKSDKPADSEKSGKSESSEKSNKSDDSGKSEKSDSSDKSSEKSDKSDDSSSKSDKSENNNDNKGDDSSSKGEQNNNDQVSKEGSGAAQTVFGIDDSIIDNSFGDSFVNSIITNNSKQNEFTADSEGVADASQAGYHPAGLAGFLMSIQSLEDKAQMTSGDTAGANVSSVFSYRHPKTTLRLEQIKNEISDLKVKGVTSNKIYRNRFQEIISTMKK